MGRYKEDTDCISDQESYVLFLCFPFNEEKEQVDKINQAKNDSFFYL